MKKLFSLLAILGFATTARAGILLEPYLGYEMQTLKATSASGADVGGKGTAWSLGARLGYKFSGGFWMAADPQLGMSGKFKYDDTNSGFSDRDYTRTQVYLDFGYDFPSIVRLWAGYAVMNELKSKDSSSEDKLKGGTAYKVGVNFQVMPLLAVGLEYHSTKPKDMETSTGTNAVSDIFGTYEDTATLVTVSMPFHFGGK